MNNIFDQSPYECRMDWGVRGVKEASDRGDIIIIVDVLSFSSVVVNALHFGAIVYPFPRVGDIEEFAKLVEAEICIVERTRARQLGLPSLSATSFNQNHGGRKFVLSSVNGATCVNAAVNSSALLIGSLLNVSGVALVANKLQKESNANITVIASGERWSREGDEQKEFRPSIEDYLGAGAILQKFVGSKSPEARVCISAFESSKADLNELVVDSSSGRELVQMEFPEDVAFCCQFDLLDEVPILTKDGKGHMYFKNYNE